MVDVALPEIHNDPFEWILVAEAIHHQCRIMTKRPKNHQLTRLSRSIKLFPFMSSIWRMTGRSR